MLDLVEGDTRRRVTFSGDIGNADRPLLRPPTPPPPSDVVVMESTYGNRVHGDIHSMHDDLARVVGDTVKRGGKVIVPAFAVGRTQEIVYSLNVLWTEGRLPDIPVFVDSPLSVNVTEVFRLHPDCFDKETKAFAEDHGSPFSWKNIRYVSKVEDSIKLNTLSSSRDSTPLRKVAVAAIVKNPHAGRFAADLSAMIEDSEALGAKLAEMARNAMGQ